ncbi:uncharacterized protein LOC111631036 isoform X2 [Centruroides sculpturatus]|nr:uncharacterized protein LOC111631036 isoform X2 [Centruroides sculpturatus]
MFEFGVDIALLQGALISSLRNVNSQQEADDEVKEESVPLNKDECIQVAGAVFNSCLELIDELKSQTLNLEEENCKRRMHAAILYTVMKKDKLKGQNDYFESLTNVFPDFHWNLYFELVKAFQWEEFHVECIASLPLNVAHDIVQLSIEYSNEQPADNDGRLLLCCIGIILHLCCQIDCEEETESIIDPILKNITSKIELMQLEVTNGSNNSNQCLGFSLTILSLICKHIWEMKYEDSVLDLNNLDDRCIPLEVLDDAGLSKKFENITLRLLKCVTGLINVTYNIIMCEGGKSMILNCLKENTLVLMQEVSSFRSVEIPFRTFAFCICQNIKEFLTNDFIWQDPSLETTFLSIKDISDFLIDAFSFNFSSAWMLHGTLSWTNDILLYEYTEIMDQIWGKKNKIAEDSIVEFLERREYLLSEPKYLSLLMNNVICNEVTQTERMIKIILNAFANLPSSCQQQEVLKNILNSYGIPSVFKANDFEVELTHFLNQIVSYQAAENMPNRIYVYCLQSPADVITSMILQAINNNKQIGIISQMFQDISFLCRFKESTNSPALFVKCFCNVTSEGLSEQELNNAITLIRILTQKNDKDELIVLPDDLLLWYILPNLKTSGPLERLDFGLGLLQVIAERIFLENKDKVNRVALIFCLYRLLQYFSLKRDAGRRQTILIVLTSLTPGLLQNHSVSDVPIRKLFDYLKSINSIWYLHLLSKFENREIERDDLKEISHVYLLSGSNFGMREETVSELIEESSRGLTCDISYSYLVISLSEVLLCSTFEEWKFLYSVVCSYYDSDCNFFPPDLVLSDEVLKFDTCSLKAVHTFIDALLLLNNNKVPDIPWHYILSSLNKLIQDVSTASENIDLVRSLFCEVCRLASMLDVKLIDDISILLLDLACRWTSSASRNKEKENLMLNCLKTVTSCESVTNILKQFNK